MIGTIWSDGRPRRRGEARRRNRDPPPSVPFPPLSRSEPAPPEGSRSPPVVPTTPSPPRLTLPRWQFPGSRGGEEGRRRRGAEGAAGPTLNADADRGRRGRARGPQCPPPALPLAAPPMVASLDFQGPSDPLRTLPNREALFRRSGPAAARCDSRPLDDVSKKRKLFPGGRPTSPRSLRASATITDPNAGILTGFPFAITGTAPTTPRPEARRPRGGTAPTSPSRSQSPA